MQTENLTHWHTDTNTDTDTYKDTDTKSNKETDTDSNKYTGIVKESKIFKAPDAGLSAHLQ